METAACHADIPKILQRGILEQQKPADSGMAEQRGKSLSVHSCPEILLRWTIYIDRLCHGPYDDRTAEQNWSSGGYAAAEKLCLCGIIKTKEPAADRISEQSWSTQRERFD